MSTNITGAATAAAARRVAEFCSVYGPETLFLAKVFLYAGLATGVALAAAEAYKLYREARAVSSTAGPRAAAATPGAGDIVKELVGVLAGAKAWLALVIVGVMLLWLAGHDAPVCLPR